MNTIRLSVRSLAVLVVCIVPAASAVAGIADSPLPVLSAGKATLHLYSVAGIEETGVLSTFISCTSTDTAAMQVGVEVFGSAGGAPFNDAAATSLSVGPGATVIFATHGAAGISIDSNLSGGFTSKGSARILATSKKLVCTAFLADPGNAPPTSMVHLDVISKLKQRGV